MLRKQKNEIGFKQIIDQLETVFNTTVLSVINKDIDQVEQLLDKIQRLGHDSMEQCTAAIKDDKKSDFYQLNAHFNLTIRAMAQSEFKKQPSGSFSPAIIKFLVESFETIEKNIGASISDDFDSLILPEWKDAPLVALLRKGIYKTGKLPYLFRKPEFRDFNDLKSNNALVNFLFYHLIINNLKNLIPSFDKVMRQRIKLIQHYWEIENELQYGLLPESLFEKTVSIEAIKDWNHKTIKKQLSDQLQQYRNEFSAKFYDTLKTGFSETASQSGTKTGYKAFHFPLPEDLSIECSKLTRKYINQSTDWHNTLFLLVDDWVLNLEINGLRFLFLKDGIDLQFFLQQNFAIPYHKSIDALRKQIKEINEGLGSISTNSATPFIQALNKQRTKTGRLFNQRLFAGLVQLPNRLRFDDELTKNLKKAMQRFDGISQTNYLIKHARYDKPLKAKEFLTISPLNLVGYKMKPKYARSVEMLATAFANYQKTYLKVLNDVPGVVNFSFVSGIRNFEQHNNRQGAIQIVQQGLDRAEIKVQELIDLYQKFNAEDWLQYNQAIETLNNKLNEIKANESALQIKIEVTRLKISERLHHLAGKMVDFFHWFFPKIKDALVRALVFLRLSSKKISSHLKVEKEDQYISSDVSDFLVSYKQKISSLPFVYQQLFSFDPVTEREFYFDRPEPWNKLLTAYQRWQEGKYAPVVIAAEEGAGKTTLLKKFTNQIQSDEETIYLDLNKEHKNARFHYTEIENTTTDFINHYQKDQSKVVIVVDGAERLFDLNINGFGAIQNLIRLISETHQKVFWVLSFHLISWNFLDKTSSLSDYFGYLIKFPELSTENLQQLIELRHKLSGFEKKFAHPHQKKYSLNLKRTDSAELQVNLKREYFETLKKKVKGNIRQAFLYWLISTKSIGEKNIVFDQNNLPDTRLISSIKKDKLLIIRTILIKHGITIEDLANIRHMNKEHARLTLIQLLDDGLLEKHDDLFVINPMIYRQIIDELYNQNLLH